MARLARPEIPVSGHSDIFVATSTIGGHAPKALGMTLVTADRQMGPVEGERGARMVESPLGPGQRSVTLTALSEWLVRALGLVTCRAAPGRVGEAEAFVAREAGHRLVLAGKRAAAGPVVERGRPKAADLMAPGAVTRRATVSPVVTARTDGVRIQVLAVQVAIDTAESGVAPGRLDEMSIEALELASPPRIHVARSALGPERALVHVIVALNARTRQAFQWLVVALLALQSTMSTPQRKPRGGMVECRTNLRASARPLRPSVVGVALDAGLGDGPSMQALARPLARLDAAVAGKTTVIGHALEHHVTLIALPRDLVVPSEQVARREHRPPIAAHRCDHHRDEHPEAGRPRHHQRPDHGVNRIPSTTCTVVTR